MSEILRVVGVRKRYGTRRVLDRVSFAVESGQIVGLLGSNGAGKSTLLRIVAGIDEPDAGEVQVLPDEGGPQPGRNPIGALLDPSWLDDRLTCRDHVGIALRSHGLTFRRDAVDGALDAVGLTDARGRRVSRLSLGMQQRLALCVAMVHTPRLLVLDEPANGLDPDGVLWLRWMLRRFADDGGAVLLSSHLMSEMERVAHRVVLLDRGRLQVADAASQWGAVRSVVIESRSDVGQLRALVEAAGGTYADAEPHRARIEGLDGEQVFLLAAENGLALSRLSEDADSLEDYYRAVVSRDERPT